MFINLKPNDPPTSSRPDESNATSLDACARSFGITELNEVPNVVVSVPVVERTLTRPTPVFGPPTATTPALLTAILVAAAAKIADEFVLNVAATPVVE